MRSAQVTPRPVPPCSVCKLPGRPGGATLCRRCKVLRDRPDTRKGFDVDHEARERQMRKQWNSKVGAFRCAYTGLPLSTDRDADGPAGPLVATWEHRDPRSPTKASEVVLVGWLVNDMKSDLNEREFKKMVRALAARFGTPSAPALNPNTLPRGWFRGSKKPPDQKE